MFKRRGRFLALLAFLGFLAITVGPAAWVNVGFSQEGSVGCYFEKDTYLIAEDGGTLSIKILLSAKSKIPVSVFVKTQQCTATAILDYQALGEAGQPEKVVTFPPGTTEQILTIGIVKDEFVEGNETFSVVLYSPKDCVLATPNNIAVSIIDCPPLTVNFVADDFYFPENIAGGKTMISAKLNFKVAYEVKVDLATLPASAKQLADYKVAAATAGVDYEATVATFVFPPNTDTAVIYIKIIDDQLSEGNEAFAIELKNPVNCLLGSKKIAVCIIQDNEPAPPKISFSSATFGVPEGMAATITVSLDKSYPTGVVSVQYKTKDGTAITPDDYRESKGILEFLPGEVMKSFQVEAFNDYVKEPDETVLLELFNPVNGIINLGNATLTIKDSPDPVAVSGAMINPVTSGTIFGPDDPLNRVRNPAAIVIEDVPTMDNVAVVECNYGPSSADPNQLEWVIKSVMMECPLQEEAEVRAEFFTAPGWKTSNIGKIVYVNGKKEGRIRIELWKKGADKTKLENRWDYLEANVVTLKKMAFRVNLLAGTTDGVGTKVTQEMAERHVKMANIYLRQVGVTLIPDDSKEVTDAAVMVKTGYFTAKVTKDEYTKGVTVANAYEESVRVNFRPTIVQINYIQSFNNSLIGYAPLTPSNSWGDDGPTISLPYRITGAQKDAKEEKLTLMKSTLYPSIERNDNWGIVISGANGDNGYLNGLLYANTIAHELGHVMLLAHRAPTEDGLTEPGNLNIMYGSGNVPVDDLDLIQLKALRGSVTLQPVK